METNQDFSPSSIHKGQGENTKSQGQQQTKIVPPDFNYEKYSIGFEDIKNESEQLLKQSNKANENRLNRFPIEVFPSVVEKIIRATNESLNFPTDFIGTSILYSTSLAIGNTHKVEVMKGWQENAVLYLAIVGRAGTNKSHPLSFALQPILEQDKRTHRQYESQRQEYEKAIRLTRKEREQQGIDEPIKPIWPKNIVSDFTPEALAEIHKFNKRGVGVYADELAGWFKNFNRYNKGSEMEFWLSVWSGKPINIDRKTGEPVFIPQPFIPVIGTIQNGILDEMGKDSRTQNGFIDRILFAIPNKLEKLYWSEIQISPTINEDWQRIIFNLLELPLLLDENHCPQPHILPFSPEAWQVLKEWQRKNTDLSNNAENEHIGSIYSKLETYTIRLALILELISWACGESSKQVVGIKAVNGAIQLIEYFRNTSLKVHAIISNYNPLEKLTTDKRKLYEILPEVFTTVNGVSISEQLGISERTFKYFLNDKVLFKKIKRGEYEKIIQI